jgi:hypothetical protein
MAAQDTQLVALYVDRGVLTPDQRSLHLATNCPRSSTCWASEPATRVPPPASVAGELSAPWIGPQFATGRLVLVLENLRDFGGWDLRDEAHKGMRYLARCARGAFARGDRVLFRGNGYPGTRVWHQAISYAATWLSTLGTLRASWPGDTVSSEGLVETIDQIAMVQHVKCSPIGERSRASDAMWRECGRHLLQGELSILRPERVIVVGSNHNARAMRDQVLPGTARGLAEQHLRLGSKNTTLRLEERTLDGRPVQVVVVKHPASPGGTSRKFFGALRELVGSTAH